LLFKTRYRAFRPRFIAAGREQTGGQSDTRTQSVIWEGGSRKILFRVVGNDEVNFKLQGTTRLIENRCVISETNTRRAQ